jgi:IPT/TIG domain
MANEAGPSTNDAGHGGENASLLAAGTTGTLLALAAVLVLYVLVAVWPPAPSAPVATTTTATTGPTTTTAGQATPPTTIAVQPAPNPPVRLFGWDLPLEREARLFLVVALAGALGGLVYAIRSLAWYAGNRNLKYSWLLTYPLQPVVGAALATITYVVARGGLIVVTTQASSDTVNPFGFAAIGGLVGLFSSQAAEWLKRIFEQVFTAAPKGKDAAVEITAVDPDRGPEGTPVTIKGTGLAGAQTVTFGGVEAAGVIQASDTELQVIVPKDAKTGPITVTTPAGTATTTAPFMVVRPEEESPAPDGEQPAAAPGAPPPTEEAAPEFDPEEHLEAGLGELSPDEITDLDRQAAAEHGEPAETEVEDAPLDEEEDLLPSEEDEEGGDVV